MIENKITLDEYGQCAKNTIQMLIVRKQGVELVDRFNYEIDIVLL